MGQFEDMDTFVRIVDAGSISRAAEQLGVVKSAVSRRLNDLESRLGVQLLARTTRKSSLTEAGQNYYERAQHIIADVAEVNSQTSDSRTHLRGSIRISAPFSFGLNHLTPIVSDFAKAHPDIVVNMDFNDRRVDLVDEGFDLAIRIARLKDSTLKARKLVDIGIVVCASPEYLRLNGVPETPADLKRHRVLHYSLTGPVAWPTLEPKGRVSSTALPVNMLSNNGDFLCKAAVDGHGVIISPSFMVWEDIQSGRLLPILCAHRLPSLTAYAVYPQTRHLPQKVRLLIDELATQLKRQPHWHLPQNS